MSLKYIFNWFTHLENLEIPYGIFIVDNSSYGITVCRLEDSSCYVFFDSHGRTNTGASGGPYSATLYFDNVHAIATFIFQQFREATGFSLHPVQFSRQTTPPSIVKDRFTTIVSSNSIESVSSMKGHTLRSFVHVCTFLCTSKRHR